MFHHTCESLLSVNSHIHVWVTSVINHKSVSFSRVWTTETVKYLTISSDIEHNTPLTCTWSVTRCSNAISLPHSAEQDRRRYPNNFSQSRCRSLASLAYLLLCKHDLGRATRVAFNSSADTIERYAFRLTGVYYIYIR